jgi:hypothetical protein
MQDSKSSKFRIRTPGFWLLKVRLNRGRQSSMNIVGLGRRISFMA